MDNLDGDEHPFRNTLAAFFCFGLVFLLVGGVVMIGHAAQQLPGEDNASAIYGPITCGTSTELPEGFERDRPRAAR